jgi:two-component system cell cycle response regulator DivK
MNARLIQALLSPAGLLVAVAGDAERALEALERLTPALILMDMQLPGMSGLDLTRILKADPSKRSIPIVALTANDSSGDQQAMMSAGCEGFISKPIDSSDFAGRIGAFVTCGRRSRLTSAADAEFCRLKEVFLSEGIRESRLLLRLVEQGAKDLDFIEQVLHRWIGCGESAGIPEISVRARKMHDLITFPGPDMAALTEEANALRLLFDGAHAALASGSA